MNDDDYEYFSENKEKESSENEKDGNDLIKNEIN